jgi:hypothetical protein
MKIEVGELLTYSTLCNDEFGETCNALAHMSLYANYLTDDFVKALEAEIKRVLEHFRENAKIVEKEETTRHIITTLEWIE